MTINKIMREVSNKKTCKIVLAGEGAVGKTTISKRLVGTLEENDSTQMTCGIDYHTLEITNGMTLNAQLYDLGGQERFRCFQSSFFKGASIVVIVFSVEWFHSYLNLDQWLEMIQDENPLKVYLIANKIDAENRCITKEEVERFACERGISYYEISALKGIGFNDFEEDIKQTIKNFYEEDQIHKKVEQHEYGKYC